jgi:hypothetical protein
MGKPTTGRPKIYNDAINITISMEKQEVALLDSLRCYFSEFKGTDLCERYRDKQIDRSYPEVDRTDGSSEDAA